MATTMTQRLPKPVSLVGWIAVIALGTFALAAIALNRGESIDAMWFIVAAVCVYALGYRFYSAFLAAKVFALDPTRATPAERFSDGRDFVPTNRWIVFGHHFAAIAGPGPLIGPTLAAQFGYLPGTLWILIGAVLGGCVQDFVALFCSIRRDGRSLGQMARDELGPIGGAVALIGVMAIMIILIAVLGLVVVNAMRHSPWATSTVAATIPIAMLIGLFMRASAPRARARRHGHRRRAAARGRVRRRLDRRSADAAHLVRLRRAGARADGHPLRLRGGGAAGVAAARAARLSLDVHEDRHDRRARDRDPDPESRRCRCRR